MQAGLYQVLTTNIEEKQISTHDDLIQSNIPKIVDISLVYVDDIPNMVVTSPERAVYTLLELYQSQDDIAVMTSESAALYFYGRFRRADTGWPKYRLLNTALMRFHCTVHFQKGHPIFDLFEYWLFRVHAGGFTNKISSILKSRYESDALAMLDVALPLDLSDVEVAFYILVFGNIGAIGALILEYVIAHINFGSTLSSLGFRFTRR